MFNVFPDIMPFVPPALAYTKALLIEIQNQIIKPDKLPGGMNVEKIMALIRTVI